MMVLTYRKEVIRQGKRNEIAELTPALITHSKSGLEFRIQSPEGGTMHQPWQSPTRNQLLTCGLKVVVNQAITFFPS